MAAEAYLKMVKVDTVSIRDLSDKVRSCWSLFILLLMTYQPDFSASHLYSLSLSLLHSVHTGAQAVSL